MVSFFLCQLQLGTSVKLYANTSCLFSGRCPTPLVISRPPPNTAKRQQSSFSVRTFAGSLDIGLFSLTGCAVVRLSPARPSLRTLLLPHPRPCPLLFYAVTTVPRGFNPVHTPRSLSRCRHFFRFPPFTDEPTCLEGRNGIVLGGLILALDVRRLSVELLTP